MASATARPTFSFFNLLPPSPSSKPSKSHLICTLKPPTTSVSLLHKRATTIFSPRSVDVSQDNNPLSQQEQESIAATKEEEGEVVASQNDRRRPEEKFAVLNTGIYECRSCGYRYDESAGDPSYPIPPGLQFAKLPDDWRCPTCGAAQSFFESKSVEIAGFAQNQQFGLGANTLTSGQKALLIYAATSQRFSLSFVACVEMKPTCSIRTFCSHRLSKLDEIKEEENCRERGDKRRENTLGVFFKLIGRDHAEIGVQRKREHCTQQARTGAGRPASRLVCTTCTGATRSTMARRTVDRSGLPTDTHWVSVGLGRPTGRPARSTGKSVLLFGFELRF